MATWTAPRTWVDSEVPDDTIMNAHIRDDLIVIGQHIYAPKTADESRSNTGTVAADTSLTFPVSGTQTWEWKARVYVVAGAGGFRWNIQLPSGSTGDYTTKTANLGASSPFGGRSSAYNSDLQISSTFTDSGWMVGVFVTGSTAGSCTLAWSQGTSNAAVTTLKAGSYIIARRIA